MRSPGGFCSSVGPGKQLVVYLALAHEKNRNIADQFVDLGGQFLQQLLAFAARFLAHQIADRLPMLEIGRLDHIEQRDPAAGVAGPAAGESQGHAHFFGLIDHDKENAVAGPFLFVCRSVCLVTHTAKPVQPLRNARWASHPAINAMAIAIRP